MKNYEMIVEVNGEEKTIRWSGYDEQVAIAQCFLSEAQQGARSLKVLEIKEIK